MINATEAREIARSNEELDNFLTELIRKAIKRQDTSANFFVPNKKLGETVKYIQSFGYSTEVKADERFQGRSEILISW